MILKKYIALLVIAVLLVTLSCSETKRKPKGKIKEIVYDSQLSTAAKKALTKKLDKYFTDQSRHHRFNGSVLIAKKNEIIFSGDYGFANFANKTELNDSSIYQLASLSKQFTAAAIVILQQEGKLDYDDTITKFYPDFHYNKVTIRQCLNHTAGLPKYFWIAENKWEYEYPPTNQQMMEMMEDDDVLPYFGAGRKYAYSNSAYMVLAAIIEKVSGLSYSEFLKENIFVPLEMNNSFAYSFTYDKDRNNQLYGYRKRGRRYIKIPGTINDGIVGDKNIYSTTYDLFKWYKVLNSNRLISDSSRNLMYSLGKTSRGYEIPYGFGFHIKEKNGEKIIFHNGKWNGFRNTFSQYPDDDLLIIVLEHSSYRGFSAFVNSVKGIVDEFDY